MKKMSKKKKIIISVIAVVLAAAIAVTSIIIIKNKNAESDDYESEPVVFDKNYIEDADAKEVFEIDYTDPVPVKYNKELDNSVKSDMSSFIDELEAKKVDFEYEDYFDIKEIIKNQKPLKSVSKHKFDITNGIGVIDENELYKTILENNKNYFKSLKAQEDYDKDLADYDELSKKDIQSICRYIAKYINYASKNENWQDVDFERVYCNLSTLKILHSKNGFAIAEITEDNIFSLNNDNLDDAKNVYAPDPEMSDEAKLQYAWDVTIIHEVVHLMQDACPCIEEDDEYLLSNMRIKDDDELHPLFCYWIPEASAELGMAELFDTQPGTYFEYINNYYTALFSFFLDDGVSPKKIMRMSFDKNNFPYYKAFGNLSEDETAQLATAMFYFELASIDKSNFNEIYGEKNNVEIYYRDDLRELIKQTARADAMKYFSKRFYLSLAKQINENKISFNDMFYLIKLFERNSFEVLVYNMDNKTLTSNDFFDYYLEIQDSFFEAVSDESISKDELIEELEKYTYQCQKGKKAENNFDLSWMNNEQKEALEKIRGNLVLFNLPSIRQTKALYVEKGYDKNGKF